MVQIRKFKRIAQEKHGRIVSYQIPVAFLRVELQRGAADAERDIRGFALKFYTEEGNWDIVGNNTPVFFFRDPLRFPGPQPRDQARSAHRPAQRRQQLGFLDACCRRRCTRSRS